MKPIRKIKDFKQREDGSLLIFFVVSIVAILGIMALSFDMGRRASTQSDMQSFADNVALAAAGELDGQPDAITRATAAAQNAIVAANEQLKAGASGSATTLALAPNASPADPATDGLVFYSDLPANDAPASYTVASLRATKYDLPTGVGFVTANPSAASFVGVRLNSVDVGWMFANIFGSGNLPDPAIGAVAVAGNAGFACDFAPLMFCLPRDSSGNPVTLTRGQGVRVATSGNNAAWNPGQFGFLDINTIPSSARGPCTMNNEAQAQACLLARRLSACFSSGGVDIQPGQRTGQEYAQFNMPFGVYSGSMGQHSSDAVYAMGPHAVSGLEIRSNNCNVRRGSADTMAFPEDDCQVANNCSNYPSSSDPDDRFGDGDWSSGRTTYVNTNYTFQNSAGTTVPGSFFDFPETNLTRYEYYLREIERAANGGVMSSRYAGAKYAADNDGGRNAGSGGLESTAEYTTWDDYWPDILPASGVNPIIPDAHGRGDNGLPQCNAQNSTNADRRVVIVAGIDCPPGAYSGRQRNVPVVEYYRSFQLSPARIQNGGGSGPSMEIDVEIIESLGPVVGGNTSVVSPFRQVIQLYK